MIDTPIVLIALGMSAASGIALALARRKRRQLATPSHEVVASMGTAELQRLLETLQPGAADHESVRRRLVLLVVEELEQRQAVLPARER